MFLQLFLQVFLRHLMLICIIYVISEKKTMSDNEHISSIQDDL